MCSSTLRAEIITSFNNPLFNPNHSLLEEVPSDQAQHNIYPPLYPPLHTLLFLPHQNFHHLALQSQEQKQSTLCDSTPNPYTKLSATKSLSYPFHFTTYINNSYYGYIIHHAHVQWAHSPYFW